LSELKAEPVGKKLRRYKQINLSTSCNKNEQQNAKKKLNYRPNGGKRLGTPLKKLLDEAKTGLLRPTRDG